MRKNINRHKVIFLLILWNIGLCAGCSKASDIQDNGNQISINSGKFHVVMEKGMGHFDNYLVVGGSVQAGMYFDATLLLIPMAKVEDLAAKYGDFLRCSNPGEEDAKRAFSNWIIIAANAQIRDKINKLVNKIEACISYRKVCHPVIKINVAELKMLKFTARINGVESPVQGNMGSMAHFLVKDIEIINDDYYIN